MIFSRLEPADRNTITEKNGTIHLHGFRNLEETITVFKHSNALWLFNTMTPSGMDFEIRDNKSKDELLYYLLSDSIGYIFGYHEGIYFKTPFIAEI